MNGRMIDGWMDRWMEDGSMGEHLQRYINGIFAVLFFATFLCLQFQHLKSVWHIVGPQKMLNGHVCVCMCACVCVTVTITQYWRK